MPVESIMSTAEKLSEWEKLKSENARYRAALVAMVGESDPEELKRMEDMLNKFPIANDQRQMMLLGLRALIEIEP